MPATGSTTHPTNVTLTAKQAAAVSSAVSQWASASLISPKTAAELLETIDVRERALGWAAFAKYALRLAVLCLAAAVLLLASDHAFLGLVARAARVPAPLRALLAALAAAALHALAWRRSLALPRDVYLNEAVHGAGAVALALAAHQLRRAWASPAFDLFLSLALCVVYGVVGVVGASQLVWSTAFFVFVWVLLRTGDEFGIKEYWFETCGVAGLVAIASAALMRGHALVEPLSSTTRVWGLLYMFVALWMLSIFGDHEGVRKKDGIVYMGHRYRRNIVAWSLALLAAALVCIWRGLRHGDSTAKGFGLAFLGINFFTRLISSAWGDMPKGLFFALLAVLLALVGRYAEAIWNADLKGYV